MANVMIKKVSEYISVYKDTSTGIAWVEDGTSGCGHSCHPNINASGSVRGMKKLGYWRKEDRCVKSHGFVYNIDKFVASDALDQVAAKYCDCGGLHP